MATVGVVKAIITADTTQLKKGMNDAQRSMDQLGKNMTKVGKSMTMKVTMPLVGIGVAAAKMASDFEYSMTQIETLVGRSAQEVETLKGSVLGLSGETGRAPKELADAMFFITSAGLDAASATAALEYSAKAAAVGLGDTVVVADAVTNAMNGYGMSAEGAAYATDVLAKTVEQGKASAADLAPQFGRLIPMAAELGISFDQVGGGLAFLTRASGDAAMSATQLSGVMKSFLKPSQMAKKVLEEIGVDLHELRAAASTDLLGALQGLREKLEANGLEMSNVFEDIRGLNGALQLTGVATGAAREVFDELADSTGKLDEAFLGVQKTAQFKMSQAMAGMKASMITLGAAVLPVVVPMLQKVAEWVGKIAEAFGALPGPVQTAIVIFGVVVAAAGPLLMVIGSVTTGLTSLGIVAAGATLSLSAILAPLAAIVAVGAAVFAVWKNFSDRAKEAQERTDTLRAAWVKAEDRAGTFRGEIEGLKDQLDALNEASAEAEDAANGLAAGFGELDLAGVLLAEVVNRDVREAFNDYVSDMDRHSEMMSLGKQDYEELAFSINKTIGLEEENVKAIRDSTVFIGKEREAIIKAIRARDLSGEQLKELLRSMDATADAHVNLAKENKELAKSWLDDTDNVVAYVKALDEDTVAEIKRLKANKEYVKAATLAIDATKTATEAAKAEAEAVANNYGQYVELDSASARLLTSTDALGEGMEDVAEKVALTTSELAALSAEAATADRAMLQFAGGEDAEGRMSRAAHWEGQMVLQREERLSAERAIKAALKAQKDAIQANIYVQEEALENAEAHLAALEAQAEAAKKPVQALKDRAAAEREGFDALRGMWQAQNDLADATQTVADIEAELTRVREDGGAAIEAAKQAYRDQMQVVTGFLNDQTDAYDRQQDLIGQIADLTEERASIEQAGGDFQRELLHNLNEQVLAYHDITASVADLEGKQQELSAEALQSQRDLVTSLQAQQAAITEVEQALIDLGIVSATDAAQANISAKQAKNLIKLRDELADVETQVEAGEATLLDLIEAQDDYNKAITDARRPIDKLERATQDLSQMEKDATRIGLQLAVARDKQTIAQEALTAAQETGARTAEAKDVIDRQLLVLEQQKTAAIEEHEIATDNYTTALEEANKIKDTTAVKDAELKRLTRELEDAQWDLVASQYGVRDAEIALAEAGDKVNDAIDRMTAISPALAAEMIVMSAAARDAYPQFDTMRANLAVLEPQIASAKSAVDGFKDAIAALVREMAILNGTRINPIEVPNLPPLMGQPSGDGGGGGGGGSPAAAAIVAAVDEVAAAVAEVVTAVDAVAETGGALLDGDEFKALIDKTVDDNADAILGIQEAAALEKFLGNISAYDIPEMPVYMPKVATPSTYGSIGGPGSRGGGFPSAAAGGFVQSAGLVNVHAGETITPRGGGVNVVVNVEGSVSSERDLVESIRKGLLQAQKSGKAVVL